MTESKIEFFERAATYVLSLLFEQFPEDSYLDPRSLVDSLTEAPIGAGEPGFDPLLVLSATVAYLVDEDFARADEVPLDDGYSLFMKCRLTERGLKLLASVPATVDSDADKRRPGERLADAVESGAWGVGAQLMRELLGLRPQT